MVCTIGPKSEKREIMETLLNSGMNVMRLNFSHGDFEEHGGRITNINAIMEETGKVFAVLLDTKGPEIRCGVFKNDKEEYKKGEIVYVTKADVLGTHERFHIQCPELFNDVVPGNYILINDGKMRLTVLENDGNELK